MSTEQQPLKSLALPPSGLGSSRHISASKPCFAAGLGFKEILVEARPGDVMAGAGRAGQKYVTNLQVKQNIYNITLQAMISILLAQWLRLLDTLC